MAKEVVKEVVDDPVAAAKVKLEARKVAAAASATPEYKYDASGNIVIPIEDEPVEEPVESAEPAAEPAVSLTPDPATAAELKKTAAEVANLRATLTAAMASQPAPTAPVAEIPEPTDEEFVSNPRAAAAKLTARAAQALTSRLVPVLKTMDAQAKAISVRVHQLEYNTVRAQDPKTFDKLEPDIKAYFAAYPQEREREGSVAEVYYNILGRKHKELAAEARAEEEAVRKRTETIAPPPTPGTKKPAPKELLLTPDEMKVARGLRIDPAKYAKLLASQRKEE